MHVGLAPADALDAPWRLGERRASTWLRCDSVGRRKRSRRAAVEPAAMTAIATAAVSVIGSHGVPSDGSGDFGHKSGWGSPEDA